VSKKAGKRLVAYFLLTKGPNRPDEVIEEAQNQLRHKKIKDATIHWRQWPQVWKWLSDISKQQDVKADYTAKNLLEATIRLMEEKDMSGPTGFKEDDFLKWQDAFFKMEEFRGEVRRTMKLVKSNLEKEKITCIKDPLEKDLFPRDLKYRFKGENWREVEKNSNLHLSIDFNLTPEDRGVGIGIWWDIKYSEERKEMVEKISKGKKSLDDKYAKFELYPVEDGIWIDNSPDFKDLETGEDAVTTLVNRVTELRDFANNIPTLRKATGYRETRRKRRNS